MNRVTSKSEGGTRWKRTQKRSPPRKAKESRLAPRNTRLPRKGRPRAREGAVRKRDEMIVYETPRPHHLHYRLLALGCRADCRGRACERFTNRDLGVLLFPSTIANRCLD